MQINVTSAGDSELKSKTPRPRKNKKKTILISVICAFTAIVFVVMPVVNGIVYSSIFGQRYETAGWLAYAVSDFEGLKMEACSFPSDKGQLLAGYRYSKEDGKPVKGVVVLAHGLGGGGHNTYMDVADYFTSNGYLVFAFDATGNDKSEGNSVKGLPQGVIDLDYALRYVKQEETYQDLPVVLFGHSWGGYSAGNVLNCHPDVRAAVIVAGFDRSSDLIELEGANYLGPATKLFMPYVLLYERLLFGKYASYCAIDGFAASGAGIMVIHSQDDTVVPAKYGYDKFYETYGDSEDFCFIEYQDRGHSYLYYSDASAGCREQLNEDYIAYVEANGGEYNEAVKTEFMEKYLDKSKCFALDYDLMAQILTFYDSYCKGV